MLGADKREIVIVKYSGEALCGEERSGQKIPYDKTALDHLVKEIKGAHNDAHLGIVVGAGNIARGAEIRKLTGADQEATDKMGMLFTMANGRLLSNLLNQAGITTRVMTAIVCPRIAEEYGEIKARHRLNKGDVLIFVAGTGRAGFSTDTAAILTAMDLGARKVIKATKVEYLFDSDPKENKNAKPIENITAEEFLKKRFKQILDQTAVIKAQECGIAIQIIGANIPGNLVKAVRGEAVGSLISP